MAETLVPTAPVIRTGRLVLRAHRRDDFAPLSAMWREPEVVRHIGDGVPMSEEEVWAKLLRFAGLWALLGFGFWAVEDKASGRLVGEVGFLDRGRADPLLSGAPEAGWALAAAFQGRGYGSEAMRAVLDWGDRRFERSVCVIDPDNQPSIALARRLGYADLGEVESHGRRRLAFQRRRNEARQQRPADKLA